MGHILRIWRYSSAKPDGYWIKSSGPMLDHSNVIQSHYTSELIQYRTLCRQLWVWAAKAPLRRDEFAGARFPLEPVTATSGGMLGVSAGGSVL